MSCRRPFTGLVVRRRTEKEKPEQEEQPGEWEGLEVVGKGRDV